MMWSLLFYLYVKVLNLKGYKEKIQALSLENFGNNFAGALYFPLIIIVG